MAIALHADVYVPGHSPIHRWAVQPKLLSLLGLMFAIALVRQLVLIPWVISIVIGLYATSRLPLGYLLRRLPYPGLFIVAMVGALPWVSGDIVLWQWGSLALRLEGLQTAGLIMGRFLAIVITGFILLGTTPFLDILKAMRSLGLPPLLTDMALLTYRYLYDVANQLATMRQAMRLRGYGLLKQTLRRQWGWLAALFGSLLLRSYERSQRVYKAMRLRGYGQRVGSRVPPLSPEAQRVESGLGRMRSGLTHLGATVRDMDPVTLGATGLTLGAAISLVFGEWILSCL